MKISKSSLLIAIIIGIAIIASIVIILRTATNVDKKTTIGNVFTYDIKELSKTDPNLIKYKEISKIKTGFQNPSAVATDSNDSIYVAGDKSIKVCDAQGNVASEIKLTDSPVCLKVVDGKIYIGMKDHLEVYNTQGSRIAKWESLGQNAIITSVDVYGENVFIANAGDRAVLRYDISGKLKDNIGKHDSAKNITGFIVPSPHFDLAVARDGLLRIVNPGLHKIETYTFDGDMESSWGETSASIKGFSGCCNPVNFAILPNGKFVTCEKGIPRVKIYSATGVFESVVAGIEAFANTVGICDPDAVAECTSKALDVAVDSKGRILLLDPKERTIRIFVLRG
jgi:hypothetical protein